jgi:hypothetical protein
MNNNFKHNFRIFSIILFVIVTDTLAIVSLNPEFWQIQTTYFDRTITWLTLSFFFLFILSMINWKMIKNEC